MKTNASHTGMVPIRKTGTASKNPRKKISAGASRYDGLMTCVENSSVHGTVISQPQTSHSGNVGSLLVMYQANRPRVATDSRFNRTNGASGIATILKGNPTRRGWRAPGISLLVHTTSAPKYGLSPVA